MSGNYNWLPIDIQSQLTDITLLGFLGLVCNSDGTQILIFDASGNLILGINNENLTSPNFTWSVVKNFTISNLIFTGNNCMATNSTLSYILLSINTSEEISADNYNVICELYLITCLNNEWNFTEISSINTMLDSPLLIFPIAIDSTGQYISYVNIINNTIYYSINYGTNFNTITNIQPTVIGTSSNFLYQFEESSSPYNYIFDYSTNDNIANTNIYYTDTNLMYVDYTGQYIGILSNGKLILNLNYLGNNYLTYNIIADYINTTNNSFGNYLIASSNSISTSINASNSTGSFQVEKLPTNSISPYTLVCTNSCTNNSIPICLCVGNTTTSNNNTSLNYGYGNITPSTY